MASAHAQSVRFPVIHKHIGKTTKESSGMASLEIGDLACVIWDDAINYSGQTEMKEQLDITTFLTVGIITSIRPDAIELAQDISMDEEFKRTVTVLPTKMITSIMVLG